MRVRRAVDARNAAAVGAVVAVLAVAVAVVAVAVDAVVLQLVAVFAVVVAAVVMVVVYVTASPPPASHQHWQTAPHMHRHQTVPSPPVLHPSLL